MVPLRSMARKISPSSDFDSLARQYAQFRTLREKGESEEAKLKKDLLGVLAERGDEDAAGHRTLPTSEPLTIGKKKNGEPKVVVGFQRQRRVSQRLDATKTEDWLAEHGLLSQCVMTEVVLNEDAVIALNFSGAIPDDVFQGFYTESESFALTLIEGDDDD